MKFNSINDLKINPNPIPANEQAYVLGYYTPGDGGGGEFYWDATSSENADNGIIFNVIGTNPGRWKRMHTSQFNIKWFGAKGDAITNESSIFQTAIDTISASGGGVLFIPPGNYIVKEVTWKNNVFIKGAGIINTIIDCKDARNVFSTIEKTDRPVTLNADIKIGDNEFSVSGVIYPGDLIRLKSERSCTRKYTGGTVIRDYYVEGEMFKVLEINAGLVKVEGRAFYEFPVSELAEASVLTPSYGGGISNVTLRCTPSGAFSNTGLVITGHENFEIGVLRTELFNNAGVNIARSYLTKADALFFEGGSDTLTLNYGLLIEDGSKYTSVNRATGNGNRHTVAGGGGGWAVSMYNSITFVSHTKDTEDVHGVDTHSNTANWTFGSIFSTNGISISGEGHSIGDVYSVGGQCYLSYEGGYQLNFGNVCHINPLRCYNQFGFVNSTVNKMTVIFEERLDDTTLLSWGRLSKNLRINEMYYINNRIDDALSNTTANSLSSKLLISEGNYYGKLFVKGIKQITYWGNDIIIGELHTLDCGWTDAIPSTQGTIQIHAQSTRVDINKIICETTHPHLTFNTTYIRFDNASGNTDISIKNVRELVTTPYTTAILCPASWSKIYLENIALSGVKTIQAGNGSIIKNVSGLSDTLPITGQITFNGNGALITFNIPHGQSAVPSFFNVVPVSTASKGITYITADATNITVHYDTAPPTGTNNIKFNWLAKM